MTATLEARIPEILDHRGNPIHSGRDPETNLRVQQREQQEMIVRLAKRMSARYDAAQTTYDNENHWINADGLSAAAANSPEVRRTLRNRSRYEVANNSYCAGMVRTLVNDVVGTGPHIEIDTDGRLSEEAEAEIERRFMEWACAVQLADKLRTMRFAKCVDGEVFVLLTTNRGLQHPVKFDLKLYEGEQVASPWTAADPVGTDGIVLDDFGNRAAYNLLKKHPGDYWISASVFGESETIPAADMIHLFKCERPGQMRGIPEIMPGLPLYAQLRDYTLAVIAAAETAADFAVIFQTQAPPESAQNLTPLSVMELEKRVAMAAPKGWEAFQLKAEQPSTGYSEFKRQIINEAARCLNMPFNVAAADSSSYNYASGRMDHQVYFKSIEVDRSGLERDVNDRIFAAWWREAVLVPRYLPPEARRLDGQPGHVWHWDGREHVDPSKEAVAAVTLMEAGLLTESEYHARRGKNWKRIERQRAKELGVSIEEYRTLKRTQMFPSAATVMQRAAQENQLGDNNPSEGGNEQGGGNAQA